MGVGSNAIGADENLIQNWSHGGPRYGVGQGYYYRELKRFFLDIVFCSENLVCGGGQGYYF